MRDDPGRPRRTESWLALLRLAAVPFAVFQVIAGAGYPGRYGLLAWLTTCVLALGAVAIHQVSRRDLSARGQRRLGAAAMAFDTGVISAFLLIHHFEPANPIRQLLFLAVVEASVRYGIAGPVVLTAVTTPVLVLFERLRSERFEPGDFQFDYVTFQVGVQLIMGLIIGWLVHRLRSETETAQLRAAEAEELRDELGRRVDLLEAANRCARALGSSLELERAFDAFIRELGGLVPFDRVALILGESGAMRVAAASGAGLDVLPPGNTLPEGALVEEVLSGARTVYRADMADGKHPEEDVLLAIDLRSRVLAPLLSGARATGILSVLRRRQDAFSADEVELLTLLGRLVGTAMQNIRAYDAERRRVEELGRLSSLRADLVSLISHELRSPMAAVIGASRTLQQRWRELSAEQRDAFLAMIADETGRLSDLVGDVLDASCIEAGTFGYRFSEVSIAQLVRDVVASASVGQDEVPVEARIAETLPTVRGDPERLRQVLANLIDNAVKNSPAGQVVEVDAVAEDGVVRVAVTDHGPGIPLQEQTLIFEKFGRAHGGQAKPGTGLGLFIARAIAEAHGGTVRLRSGPGEGSTFSLELPLDD
ncbi:MAG: ATP-binding protein [Gaiellaceae bacterium]